MSILHNFTDVSLTQAAMPLCSWPGGKELQFFVTPAELGKKDWKGCCIWNSTEGPIPVHFDGEHSNFPWAGVSHELGDEAWGDPGENARKLAEREKILSLRPKKQAPPYPCL